MPVPPFDLQRAHRVTVAAYETPLRRPARVLPHLQRLVMQSCPMRIRSLARAKAVPQQALLVQNASALGNDARHVSFSVPCCPKVRMLPAVTEAVISRNSTVASPVHGRRGVSPICLN
ncbi:hypothetical protein TRVL_03839 [Trypanosoma vivax]|nr:hypothetical protein TRVL_03839 [Trypanosoma vivax]